MVHQRVAIIGLGNCASALLQGIALYRAGKMSGQDLGLSPLFKPSALDHLSFVCAFDIDQRKVGKPLREAIFANPNRVPNYEADLRPMGMPIYRGPTKDGIARTMNGRDASEIFVASEVSPVQVVDALLRHEVTLVLCTLPTGSQQACEFYAQAACDANAAFINGSATPVAALPQIREAFHARKIPLFGDDFKSQFGATFLNEVLIEALADRQCLLHSSDQTNVGGNTDFLNMLERARAETKERSKLSALANVNSVVGKSRITTSIAGYRPELGDTKIAEISVKARGFAGRMLNINVTLEVEDSPNAAGIITTILCAIAQKNIVDHEYFGALLSTLTMKNPWRRIPNATLDSILCD